MIQSKKKDWLVIFLVCYIFWGWFFTRTIYANSLFVYLSFVGLCLLFFTRLLKSKIYLKYTEVFLWLPFYIYVSLRYCIAGSFEHMGYWLIACLLVLTSIKTRIIEKFPYKLVLLFGLFLCVGIFFQIFQPSLYYSHVASLYINEDVVGWAESEYGFSGFTYQLAMTAEILICALVVLLAFRDRVIHHKSLRVALGLLLIISVFLTGKRMNSILSLIILFLFFLYRIKTNRTLTFIVLLIITISGLTYFFANADLFEDMVVFKRFASIAGASDQSDFDSGRSQLWGMAIDYYRMHPLFGIGPGKFAVLSHSGTDVHNVYLQTLCEYGLFGMLLFTIPLIKCLCATFRLLRKSQKESDLTILFFSFALQLNYIIEGITENTNTNLCGYLMYAVAIAIFADYKYRYQYEHSKIII